MRSKEAGTMRDNPELLAAVIANPEEDTVRLVYADWCDEDGQHDRAEFIRDQVAWWRRIGEGEPGKVEAQRRRIEKFLRTQGAIAAGTPWEKCGVMNNQFGLLGEGKSAVLRRGWIGLGRCAAAEWIKLGDATLRRHPIRRVIWTDRPQIESDGAGKATKFADDDGNTFFTWGEINKEGARVAPHCDFHVALARLRWPGVEFEIEEPAEEGATGEVGDFSIILEFERTPDLTPLRDCLTSINSRPFRGHWEGTVQMVGWGVSPVVRGGERLSATGRLNFRAIPIGDRRWGNRHEVYKMRDFNAMLATLGGTEIA